MGLRQLLPAAYYICLVIYVPEHKIFQDLTVFSLIKIRLRRNIAGVRKYL